MDKNSHRNIAIDAYNDWWDLFEAERSDANNRELLSLAFLSRAHWRLAGGPREFAISDWLVSRAAAISGHSNLAIDFALASFEHDKTEFPAWLQASLFEGAARAYAAADNSVERARYIQSARAMLANESDAENAAVIAAQIEEID